MLENETVRIEPIRLQHAEALAEWTHDPEMWTWWLREPPTTVERHKETIELALKQKEEGIREPFIVFSKPLEKYVGETSFWIEEENEIEIGSTWLCGALRGTGFNRQVKQLLIEHAFEFYGASRIILQTDELNVRSQKAIQAIGGIEFKRMKDDKIVWDGRVRSSIYYKIEKVEPVVIANT